MVRQKMIKVSLLLVFSLFVTGCVNRQNNYKKRSKSLVYTLNINGVECALCAKKAIAALETISNVDYVEFICNDNHYYDCFAKMYMKNHMPVDLELIKNKLITLGFELRDLSMGLVI